MNLPSLSVPDVGAWLSKKSLFAQMQIHFAAEYLATAAIWACGNQWLASEYPILVMQLDPQLRLLVGAPFAFLYLEAYRIWNGKNRDEALTEYALNPTLQWSLEEISDEIISAKQPVILKEDRERNEYHYLIHLAQKKKDPLSHDEYDNIVLISRRNFNEVFKDSPNGIRSHKGSIFMAPAVRGWWTWATSFKSGNVFPEESDDVESSYRIFIDSFGVYDGSEIQAMQDNSPVTEKSTATSALEAVAEVLGAKATPNLSILEAMKNVDTYASVQKDLEIRNQTSMNQKLIEDRQDAAERAAEELGSFRERDRIMRRVAPIWSKIEPKWIVVAGLGAYLIYQLGPYIQAKLRGG